MTAATAVDPRTGEILTIPEINVKMVRTLDELDRSNDTLDAKLRELGSVTFTYDVHYNAAISTSQAKSEDRRKAEAFADCNEFLLPSGESVARAKSRLEIQVRSLRDAQHNLRALLSGWQTVSANLRTVDGSGARP